MLPLRFAGRWQLAGGLLLTVAFVVALAPPIPWFDFVDTNDFGNDKLAHGVAFALLAVWFAGQLERSRYALMAAGLLLFGGLIEVAQYFTAYRMADWLDLGADAAGIAAGIGLALAGLGGWSLRAEDWLTRHRGEAS